MAVKAFAYFIVVSTFALIVGLIVANVVQPGGGHAHRSGQPGCGR